MQQQSNLYRPNEQQPQFSLQSQNTQLPNGQGPVGNPNLQLSFGLNQPQQSQFNTNMQGPNQPSNEPPLPLPQTHAEYLAYIKKKPYSQIIGGQELTYSLLPKKQKSFVMTHQRLLMLRGLEAIAYARELPPNKLLPFLSFNDVPQPKSSFPTSEIEKCQVNAQNLTIHFLGANKDVWQFECPTKNCALEWAEKINRTISNVQAFKKSNFNSLEEFQRNRRQGGYQPNSYLNQGYQGNSIINNNQTNAIGTGTNFSNNLPNNNLSLQTNISNVNTSLFNQTPPSPTRPLNVNTTLVQGPPSPARNLNASFENNTGVNLSIGNDYNLGQNNVNYSKTNTLGANINAYQTPQKPTNMFSGPQMSMITDFITPQPNSPEKFLGRSISNINLGDKENIRMEINRLRRNWLEELVGGEQEVELIMDFRNYVERVAAIIIGEFYMTQNQKIFPAFEMTKDFAVFVLDDMIIELYFYTEENYEQKHERYQQADLEFKNFEYLLSATKNEGNLKVPFMMLFEYKGFRGMAKSRVADNNAPFKNREFYGQLNVRQFEEATRVSAEKLLNEKTCKIVGYERKTSLSMTTSNQRIYFVDRLTEFLPIEKDTNRNPMKVLRGELLQDQELDGVLDGMVFRNERKPILSSRLKDLIDRKITELVKIFQDEDEYFANSKEFSDFIHRMGLNVRHLGLIYQRTRVGWFRRILKAEIISRSLKSLFKFDIQNCMMTQVEMGSSREKIQEIERKRVISFLNVIFGNTESTTGIWRRINAISQAKFGVVVAENGIGDTNLQYLLQAVQTHLKIVLNDSIHYKVKFQSTETFEPQDFQRFEFYPTIYNLEFSNLFEQIEDCLSSQTPDSFYNLSSILIKETSTRQPIIQLLKKHPIHDRISEFLLNFTSPDESRELYSKLEQGSLPSHFLYESKLAEMKWYLKTNRINQINHVSSFLFTHVRKWLGAVHPLFAQLNRLLGSYYSNFVQHFQLALKHANQSLDMQRKIFDGEAPPLWKDYFLLGKIYFNNKNVEEAMKFLFKAREMVRIQDLKEFQTFSELNLLLCKGYFGAQRYQEAYKTVKDLYALTKGQRDQATLGYILEAVNWMRQIMELNQEQSAYLQFLEGDFCNLLKNYQNHISLFGNALRVALVPLLKDAIFRRSRNSGLLISMVEELGKMAEQTQGALTGYLRQRIRDDSFPRSFLLQLQQIDSVWLQIQGGQMVDRWRQFYLRSTQIALDGLGRQQRGFQFLAVLTGLLNLGGRQVLDELHKIDRR